MDFYRDGMFDQMEVEGAEYQLKPMNCPFHVLMYTEITSRSHRDHIEITSLSARSTWPLGEVFLMPAGALPMWLQNVVTEYGYRRRALSR